MIPDGIIFSLPKDFDFRENNIKITYKDKFSAGIIDVFRNENDNLGIVVESESNGWLLYHAPYDKYWKATINSKPASIIKANGSFMAVKLQKGMNNIEYSYMPNSWLRELILLSLVISSIIFCGFVFNALRLVPSNTGNS